MRIIPVLDLKNGQIVRGIAGRRHEYRPIVSTLSSSCHPVEVALAFRDHFGLTELYLADLDAIAGVPPAFSILSEIQSLGFRLWVDAGVRDVTQAKELAAAGVERVILGLETIHGPEVLAEACHLLGSNRIIFSLDLKNGVPLGDTTSWHTSDPLSIAAQAIASGVRRLLVLDLAQVGGGSGTGTEDCCAHLVRTFPDVELIAGGGVNGIADLERLQRCGVQAVLVASALHDGRLRREDLAQFTS